MAVCRLIEVDSISKAYSGKDVLRNISFNLERGSSLSVIGPSGCGKSTLLYMIAGLVKQAEGSISIGGSEIEGTDSRIAFILQDFGLLPWKTVRDNVALGMKIRGVSEEIMKEKAVELMDDLGIISHSKRFPSSLSGGEKQRVAIARALATDPEILLMDEPFSSLDTLTREKLQNTVRDIIIDKRLSVITVTHSIEEAVFLGDRILVMSPGPGEVTEIIDNYRRPGENFRDSDSFFKSCRKIREIVESL